MSATCLDHARTASGDRQECRRATKGRMASGWSAPASTRPALTTRVRRARPSAHSEPQHHAPQHALRKVRFRGIRRVRLGGWPRAARRASDAFGMESGDEEPSHASNGSSSPAEPFFVEAHLLDRGSRAWSPCASKLACWPVERLRCGWAGRMSQTGQVKRRPRRRARPTWHPPLSPIRPGAACPGSARRVVFALAEWPPVQ